MTFACQNNGGGKRRIFIRPPKINTSWAQIKIKSDDFHSCALMPKWTCHKISTKGDTQRKLFPIFFLHIMTKLLYCSKISFPSPTAIVVAIHTQTEKTNCKKHAKLQFVQYIPVVLLPHYLDYKSPKNLTFSSVDNTLCINIGTLQSSGGFLVTDHHSNFFW